MRKSCSFHDFDASGWPSPDELKKYFSAGGRREAVGVARQRQLGLARGGPLRDDDIAAVGCSHRRTAHDGQCRPWRDPGLCAMAWSDSALAPLLLGRRSSAALAIHGQPAGGPVFARIVHSVRAGFWSSQGIHRERWRVADQHQMDLGRRLSARSDIAGAKTSAVNFPGLSAGTCWLHDFVMRGLDPPARLKPLRRGEGPRIHLFARVFPRRMDGRVGPGHDGVGVVAPLRKGLADASPSQTSPSS